MKHIPRIKVHCNNYNQNLRSTGRSNPRGIQKIEARKKYRMTFNYGSAQKFRYSSTTWPSPYDIYGERTNAPEALKLCSNYNLFECAKNMAGALVKHHPTSKQDLSWCENRKNAEKKRAGGRAKWKLHCKTYTFRGFKKCNHRINFVARLQDYWEHASRVTVHLAVYSTRAASKLRNVYVSTRFAMFWEYSLRRWKAMYNVFMKSLEKYSNAQHSRLLLLSSSSINYSASDHAFLFSQGIGNKMVGVGRVWDLNFNTYK